MNPTLDIDIFADIICPWCYIGKKRLEQALAKRPDVKPQFRWRAFLLNPSMHPSGMDRQDYLYRKFGHNAEATYKRMAKAGSEANINFQFNKIKRTPDTKPIHKLLIAAENNAYQLSEAFYQAYFIDGMDIADKQVQAQIVKTQGLDYEQICQNITHKTEMHMRQDMQTAQNMHVEGVPFMIFANSLSLAGAYPADILLGAIDAALRPTDTNLSP